MFKKISFLIFLTFSALAIAGGVLWYSLFILKADVETLSDLSGLYGSSKGFSALEQTQEKTPNGALGVTLSGNLEVTSETGLTEALSSLSKDIAKVADDELVNVNLNIEIGSKPTTYELKFYPVTPGDYEESAFSDVTSLLAASYTEGFTSYNLEIFPTTSGRYITATGGNDGTDSETWQQPEFVKMTTNHLQLNPGDVFDVTYVNQSTAVNENFVNYKIQTYYGSAWSYDQALSVNFNTIENFRDEKELGLKMVHYVQGAQPNTSEIILLINDTSDEHVKAVKQKLTSRPWSDNPLPSTYQVSVRGGENDANLITIPTYYVF